MPGSTRLGTNVVHKHSFVHRCVIICAQNIVINDLCQASTLRVGFLWALPFLLFPPRDKQKLSMFAHNICFSWHPKGKRESGTLVH